MTGRKLSDIERWQAAGMVIGGMSYRQTAERFNVSQDLYSLDNPEKLAT
jgi:transposase